MSKFKVISFAEQGQDVKDCQSKEEALEIISGGISGAITDPYSREAVTHAEMYYEEIRHNHSDVLRIAQNTDFGYEQVLMIKNYLFIDDHFLNGKIKKFDPSFEIAESWRRLAFDPKNIKPHDLTLLNHEIKEMKLINAGYSQDKAHSITSQEFNYAEESKKYYQELNRQNANKPKTDISLVSLNSGAINSTLDGINWEERC